MCLDRPESRSLKIPLSQYRPDIYLVMERYAPGYAPVPIAWPTLHSSRSYCYGDNPEANNSKKSQNGKSNQDQIKEEVGTDSAPVLAFPRIDR